MNWNKDQETVLKNVRKTEKNMRVSVKIPHDEVDRLTVNRLTQIRNATVNRTKDMSHFDKVLRFFLTDKEFAKYVIDEEEIEY